MTFSSLSKRLRGYMHHDPVHDWLMLIIFLAILLAAIIVWNVWAFDTVESGGVIGAPVTAPLPAFSTASLDSINGVFADRAAEQQKYITGEYRYTDPSQ